MANALYVLAFVATLAVLTVANEQQSYCRLKTCRPGAHTLCRFSPVSVHSRCGKVHTSPMTGPPLTQNEIDELLQVHNQLRAKVANGHEHRGRGNRGQPAAKNLGSLTWDNELATIAQAWANQCMEHGHDECRDSAAGVNIGQNIGYRSDFQSYSTTLTQLVTDWYDEVVNFDARQVRSLQRNTDPTRPTGHYTQLVWAKTTSVGCGLVRHNGPTTDRYNRTYLVCNYGPGGNWIGKPLYEIKH